MAVSFLVAVVVALLIVGVIARYLRSDPHQDVSRFHHAREITSTWSAGYQVVAEPEQPEAFEDKPELQHSVHLVEAA
jgi:hypothetical protein